VPDSDKLPISEEELNLLRELTRVDVAFMLVGLGAAVLQGADAVTKDLDLWFRSIADPGLAEAAQNVGAAFIWRNNPPLFSGPGLDDIDVVIKCDGLRDFDTEYAAAVEIALAPGVVLKVLPIDRVLASKRAADRPKDRAVVPALEAALAAIQESRQR
jgi:hypothetical protein